MPPVQLLSKAHHKNDLIKNRSKTIKDLEFNKIVPGYIKKSIKPGCKEKHILGRKDTI